MVPLSDTSPQRCSKFGISVTGALHYLGRQSGVVSARLSRTPRGAAGGDTETAAHVPEGCGAALRR
jgi:hypothetical protein